MTVEARLGQAAPVAEVFLEVRKGQQVIRLTKPEAIDLRHHLADLLWEWEGIPKDAPAR